jgi:hypothetical protein
MPCDDCTCGRGSCSIVEDVDQKAIAYWQDSLAKFWPTSQGPTATEKIMYKAGYEAGQQSADLYKAGYEAGKAESAIIESLLEDIESENARLREALEEMAKPPYADSDLKSLMEWVNARARAALERK